MSKGTFSKRDRIYRFSIFVAAAIAIVSFSTLFVAYGIGIFGGIDTSEGNPYRWDQEAPIAIVYDETGRYGEGGCVIETESGEREVTTTPRPSIIDLEAGGQLPLSNSPAEVVCENGRIFTGFSAFLVNFRTAPMCPGVVSSLIVLGMSITKRTNYERKTLKEWLK